MKRTALRTRKLPGAPTDAGPASPWDDSAETFDDLECESLFDYEHEHEAVEVVLQRMIRTLN